MPDCNLHIPYKNWAKGLTNGQLESANYAVLEQWSQTLKDCLGHGVASGSPEIGPRWRYVANGPWTGFFNGAHLNPLSVMDASHTFGVWRFSTSTIHLDYPGLYTWTGYIQAEWGALPATFGDYLYTSVADDKGVINDEHHATILPTTICTLGGGEILSPTETDGSLTLIDGLNISVGWSGFFSPPPPTAVGIYLALSFVPYLRW